MIDLKAVQPPRGYSLRLPTVVERIDQALD
jgi:hypothetical protein